MSGDFKNPLKQVNALLSSSREAIVDHLPDRPPLAIFRAAAALNQLLPPGSGCHRPHPSIPAPRRRCAPPARRPRPISPRTPASSRAPRRAVSSMEASSSQLPGCARPWQISATLAPAGGRPCCLAGARSCWPCSEVTRAGPDGAWLALGRVAGGREGLACAGRMVVGGGEGGGGEDGRRRRGWPPTVSPVRS
jgi:hypothetical protein